MIKTFPIEFIRQILEQKLYEEHLKNKDLFGGQNEISILSFYEQLKDKDEVDRFVETYRDLADQQNRTGLIGNGVILSPENPTITNLYSSLIIPMTWTCSIRTTLENRDQMIYTLNNLINELRGSKVDIAQLNCLDENDKPCAKPFMVGTIGHNDGTPTLKNGDYIGEISSLSDVSTIMTNLANSGVTIPTIGVDEKMFYYVKHNNMLKVVKVSYSENVLFEPDGIGQENYSAPYDYIVDFHYTGTFDINSDEIVQPIYGSIYVTKNGENTLLEHIPGVVDYIRQENGETIISVAFNVEEYYDDYIEGSESISYDDNEGVYRRTIGYTFATNDKTISEIVFPPTHTSFEKYKVSLSFDSIRCDEPRNLNANEYCEVSFGGSATLVDEKVKLGNDLLKIRVSKNSIQGENNITFSSNYTFLEPLEMPSGNNSNTKINQLLSNNFVSNTHTDAIALSLQYTFILDESISLLKQWFLYARYGTQGLTVNDISPNMIYQIVEVWSSWGVFELASYYAKIVESIDIENTESDTLTLSIVMQVQN